MANKQKSFPRISPNYWWLLRNKAIENPNTVFNVPTISALLNIKTTSVYSTVLPSLNQFELIDKEGKLSERGKSWINDNAYKEVCVDILESIYPIELIEDIKDPDTNRIDVENWFERKTGANRASILQMTAAYLLLWNGNPDGTSTKKTFRTPIKRRKKLIVVSDSKPFVDKPVIETTENLPSTESFTESGKSLITKKHDRTNVESAPVQETKYEVQHNKKPAININVQIEISSDTSTEQIEAIFEKMGKYLLG